MNHKLFFVYDHRHGTDKWRLQTDVSAGELRSVFFALGPDDQIAFCKTLFDFDFNPADETLLIYNEAELWTADLPLKAELVKWRLKA